MVRNDILGQVVQAANDFINRRLWKRFTDLHCIGIRIAGHEDLIIASILGSGGEQYGISLFRGPGAVASFTELLHSGGPDDDIVGELDLLGVSMEMFGHLPPDAQSLLRDAGLHPRYDRQVPQFLVKKPGQQPRLPDRAELRLLLLVMRAIIEADKKRLLQPTTLDDKDGICVLDISGKPTAPQVSVTRQRLTPKEDPKKLPLVFERADIEGLPRLDATWLVCMPLLPGYIEGDDRVIQILLVVDDAKEYILQAYPVLGADLREAVKILVETFHSNRHARFRGLPGRIIFSSKRLCDAVRPMLERAGVKCVYEPVIPKLEAVVAQMIAYFDGHASSFDQYAEVGGQIPAADDLQGWKQAEQRLHGRFVQEFGSNKQLRSSRAVKRYFGKDDLDYYLQKYDKQGVGPAYIVWSILDYRPTKTGKTMAEEMLEEGLPQAEAVLLRATMEAYPTLYRVAGYDAKIGTVELEDVLLGGCVTVHDQLMSENIENNMFLAARTFPIGNFHFVEIVGPPLGPLMGWEAVEFLQRCGIEFTPEGLRHYSHVFGWMWDWMEMREGAVDSIQFCNTDGEEIVWHIASFSLADPNQTRRALMRRPDIDYDQQSDELVWNKPAGPDTQVMGDTITLGRIRFSGDELVLTVNSVGRFRRARRWLQRMPGVTFKGVRIRQWDEPKDDLSEDEQIGRPEPVKLTPEFTAAVQERVNQHYMAWIDTPLPAFGGKTPRQVCQTEAGRRQVATFIRAMPEPANQASIHIPREAMLQELGLIEQMPASALHKAPSPIQDPPARPKVAGNAPCPCGSGRKYKKCCGRAATERSPG